jgi:hypothetical protein
MPAVTTNVARQQLIINTSGETMLILQHRTQAGRELSARTIIIPADRSKPVVDSFGAQLAATVPAALGNAIDEFVTRIDSMIATANAGGKLDL